MPELDFRAPRLFVDAPLHEGERIALERNQSNYLGNVLRLSRSTGFGAASSMPGRNSRRSA